MIIITIISVTSDQRRIFPRLSFVLANMSANFTCLTQNNVVWLFNFKKIRIGPDRVTQGNTLTIRNVGKKNEGYYQCVSSYQFNSFIAEGRLVIRRMINVCYNVYLLCTISILTLQHQTWSIE